MTVEPADVRFVGISLDCADPDELAGFYRRLLGGEVLWRKHSSVGLRTPDVLLVMHRVADHRPPTWPGASIVHLDLTAGDALDEPEAFAVSLGARPAEPQSDPRWRVLLDPAGHPFCITTVAPQTDRLGSGVRPMGRTDRVSRVIAASPATVYGALLDRASLEAWLPPDGMRGRIERWDPRPGGGFRMVLTHLDPTGSPGKTSDATDVVDVEFGALAPAERVVQRAVFDADDPSYAGVMTMTWHLAGTGEGTEVTVTATDVPPGIDQAAHEAGIASSLANLAAHVEASADR